MNKQRKQQIEKDPEFWKWIRLLRDNKFVGWIPLYRRKMLIEAYFSKHA